MTHEKYAHLYAAFLHGGRLTSILDQSHALIMVVDGDRRIVYCTQGILPLARAEDISHVLGKRPGDFFHCIHAKEAGCGNGASCCDCGALLGIRAGLSGDVVETECALTIETHDRLEARDFLVKTIPLKWDDDFFAALSFSDRTHEVRCRSMERVFLHDILNTVGAVKGILHFIHPELQGEQRELLGTVLPYFDLCVDEIAAQQKLLSAENNELTLAPERFSLGQLLQGLAKVYRQHALGSGKRIVVNLEPENDEVIADRTIIHRISMNLLKNALEASETGDTVTLQGLVQAQFFRISVNNPGCMDENVRQRIFRRSFSTKGAGRGLGIYSVQLLCANFLGGKFWFESEKEAGTTFYVQIPQAESLQQD